MSGVFRLSATGCLLFAAAPTALKVGRLKDLARIQAFLEQKAVDLHRLKGVLERHNLMDSWVSFCQKAGIANPIG